MPSDVLLVVLGCEQIRHNSLLLIVDDLLFVLDSHAACSHVMSPSGSTARCMLPFTAQSTCVLSSRALWQNSWRRTPHMAVSCVLCCAWCAWCAAWAVWCTGAVGTLCSAASIPPVSGPRGRQALQAPLVVSRAAGQGQRQEAGTVP